MIFIHYYYSIMVSTYKLYQTSQNRRTCRKATPKTAALAVAWYSTLVLYLMPSPYQKRFKTCVLSGLKTTPASKAEVTTTRDDIKSKKSVQKCLSTEDIKMLEKFQKLLQE